MEAEIKHFSSIISVTPTVSTSAYTSGDQLGDLQTLASAVRFDVDASGAVVTDIVVVDKDKQKSALDILFFSSSPTITSSDNAALNISDSEMADKFIGSVSVLAGDYIDLSANSVATVKNVCMLLRSIKATDIPTMQNVYAIACVRGTPTYSSTSALVFKYGLLQD